MKILQIIDTLNVGGAERVCIDLSNLLFEKHMEVSILTFEPDGLLQDYLFKGVPRLVLNRKNKYSILKAYQFSKILKSYDILHVHLPHVYRYVKLVCLLFGVKSKIVFHHHSGTIYLKKVPLFFKSILKPENFIGVSSVLVNYAIKELKLEPDHVFLLRNIVVKKELSTKPNYKGGMVLVGNIKRLKNQIFAIQLAATLEVELTIIGAVQEQDYYDELVREIELLGCQKRIHFKHDVSEAQELLSTFNLGIMPSIYESGPLVLAEFVAQSLPFVSFKTGEVADVLEPELPDYFLESFDKKDWLERIKKVSLESKTDLSAIFNTYFSPEYYVTTCINIYQKVINS